MSFRWLFPIILATALANNVMFKKSDKYNSTPQTYIALTLENIGIHQCAIMAARRRTHFSFVFDAERNGLQCHLASSDVTSTVEMETVALSGFEFYYNQAAIAAESEVSGNAACNSPNTACTTVGEYSVHQTACEKFLQCDAGLLWSEQPCPAGTVFDSSINNCNFPAATTVPCVCE